VSLAVSYVKVACFTVLAWQLYIRVLFELSGLFADVGDRSVSSYSISSESDQRCYLVYPLGAFSCLLGCVSLL
jgi:hypothetical protein